MVELSANPPSSNEQVRLTDLLVIAVWVGLATGWLEALVTYALRFHPTISAYHKAGTEIFWVAPLANTAVLLLATLPLAGFTRFFRNTPREIVILGALNVVGIYTVLSYPRLIASVGVAAMSLGGAVFLCRAVRGRERPLVQFLRRNIMYALLAAAAIGVGPQIALALGERLAVSRLPAAPAGAPNVLLLVIDTLRGDRLSSVGYARPTTPHLDAFGREGVQFDFAFSTAPWTVPSHNTMLTGRHTFEHLMDSPIPNLNHGFPYLPEVLARHGYRSGLFSANLASAVQEYLNAGFHHYDDHTAPAALSRLSLLRKLAWQFESRSGIRLPPPRRASLINSAFLDWVDSRPEKPFFALLNYVDVHDHYQREWRIPPPFDTKFGDAQPSTPREGQQVNQAQLDLYYDRNVAYVDDQVGRLLDALRRRGLDKNTLIIITADHGEGLGQHGHVGHQSNLYFEALHVPLLVRFPGKIPAGLRQADPVSLAALPRTIMDFLGLPSDFPGKALPLLQREPSSGENAEEPLLAEFYTNENGPKLKSLLSSRWHYARDVVTGAEELYDVKNDRAEIRNLATSPDLLSVMEGFRQRMTTLFPGLPALKTAPRPPAARAG